MDTTISIIVLLLIYEGLLYLVDEILEVDFLNLPPETDKLGNYVFYGLTILMIWNQFDNFYDMSWGYLIGFSLGSWLGIQLISYFLTIILGTFLKLKDNLD